MTDATIPEASPVPEIGTVAISDLGPILMAGARDFARAPLFGLFFSSFYVLGGLAIWALLSGVNREVWIIPLGFGFPLLAPFLAVGLYEVSRRLEAGAPLLWGEVLGVIFRQKDRQFPTMAAVIVMIFLFWIFVAHVIFALFMGLEPLTNILTDWQGVMMTEAGLKMLAFGTAVGAVLSFVLFSMTVVSLPLLLDKELDFITAIICSFQFVLANKATMLVWALLIAVLSLAALVPLFLGLLVVLPVLGHATWHLYRRALDHPA